MAEDIRVKTGLLNHFKVHKLKKLLGADAVERLLQFWIFTANNKPSGILEGMDELDIETASGWNGETGRFVDAMLRCKLLDETDGVFSAHDWAEHQGWVSGSKTRGDINRFNSLKTHHPQIWKRLYDKGVSQISVEEFARVVEQESVQSAVQVASNLHASRCAPLPSPSPLPKPSPLPPQNQNNKNNAHAKFKADQEAKEREQIRQRNERRSAASRKQLERLHEKPAAIEGANPLSEYIDNKKAKGEQR